MLERILDLPAGVRLALFGVIAAAVLALGWSVMSPTETTPADEVATTVSRPPVVAAPNGADPVSAGSDQNPTEGVDLRLEMPVEEADLKVAAVRAVKFAELYLSYRYNEDVTDRKNRIERLLADANAIDLTQAFPTGAVAQQMAAAETVLSAQVTSIEADMVSRSMLSLSVEVDSTTVTRGAAGDTAHDTYAVTMAYDAGHSDWYVSEFFLTGADAFLDEEVG